MNLHIGRQYFTWHAFVRVELESNSKIPSSFRLVYTQAGLELNLECSKPLNLVKKKSFIDARFLIPTNVNHE